MRLFLRTIIFIFIPITALSEYRVYRLGIKQDPKQLDEEEVLTTVDDLQYATYYSTSPDEQVRIIKHWMCWGRTDGFAKYCDEPLDAKSPSAPATPARSITQVQPPPTQNQNQNQGQQAQVQSPAAPINPPPNPGPATQAPQQTQPQQSVPIMLQ